MSAHETPQDCIDAETIERTGRKETDGTGEAWVHIGECTRCERQIGWVYEYVGMVEYDDQQGVVREL